MAEAMTPEQVQDIVMGTLHAAMDAGDIVAGGMPEIGELDETEEMPGMPEQPEPNEPAEQGMPQ